MDIKQLEALVLAIELGSISAAARALRRGQPLVSQWIADLEADLNLDLFTRTGNRVQPTEHAYELMPFARSMLHQQRSFQAVAERLSRGERQYLAIGLGEGLPSSVLSRVLPSVLETYPTLNLDIVRLEPARLTEWLTTGQCRVALNEESESRLPGFSYRSLPGYEEVWVAQPGLMSHLNQPVSIDDLRSFRELAWTQTDSLDTEGISPVFIQSDDWMVMIDLLMAGQGYALLPRPAVQPWLDRGELEIINVAFEQAPVHRRFELVWRTGDEDACLNLLIERLSQ